MLGGSGEQLKVEVVPPNTAAPVPPWNRPRLAQGSEEDSEEEEGTYEAEASELGWVW